MVEEAFNDNLVGEVNDIVERHEYAQNREQREAVAKIEREQHERKGVDTLLWREHPDSRALKVTDRVRAVCEEDNAPLSPLAVLGKLREGKSLLMNCLCQESDFMVWGRMEQATRAVRVSTTLRPISALRDSGAEERKNDGLAEEEQDQVARVLFVDTEGWGAEGREHDRRYGLPVFMLSRVLVFNYMVAGVCPPFHEVLEALDALMASAEEVGSLDQTTDLHIVFRDLAPEHRGHMKQELLFDKQTESDKNRTRDRLRNSFRTVDVWCLPDARPVIPGEDANGDPRFGEPTKFEDTRAQFKTAFAPLARAVYDGLSIAPTFAGNPLTCSAFPEVAERIAADVESGDFSGIHNGIVEALCLRNASRQLVELQAELERKVGEGNAPALGDLANVLEQACTQLSVLRDDCRLRSVKGHVERAINAVAQQWVSRTRERALDFNSQLTDTDLANRLQPFEEAKRSWASALQRLGHVTTSHVDTQIESAHNAVRSKNGRLRPASPAPASAQSSYPPAAPVSVRPVVGVSNDIPTYRDGEGRQWYRNKITGEEYCDLC